MLWSVIPLVFLLERREGRGALTSDRRRQNRGGGDDDDVDDDDDEDGCRYMYYK